VGYFVIMSLTVSHQPVIVQSEQSNTPRRLIVTAGVVIFAIRDWSLWVLLRDSPWGPPMRIVLGTESVTDAVDRTLEAVLVFPKSVTLLELRAGWQEQQVYVWGSGEQGAAVSLIHSVLLRANCDELRPNLDGQPVPSLRVGWRSVAKIETGEHVLDPEVRPVVDSALIALRSHIQRRPEIVLRYLAGMSKMDLADDNGDCWHQDLSSHAISETLDLSKHADPPSGDGTLTLAEAALLYRAFFPPNEQIDLSNLRRRFLSTNLLEALDEERPVRGKELDWRRVSKAYRFIGA
jgi:hypothetical protein